MAIKIEHVTKQYRLGAIGGGTLKGDLQTWWARMRGKEDPNSKIGARTDIRIGEKFLALDDINLEVKKGEAVGIIGHNGAGKSTLLKLLSRVTAPTEGKISIDGRIASMLEVGTGFHPELTGRENIYMNGAILGMTKAEIDKKFDEIVEFSEVAKFIDTPVKRYSSGMYVKLAFSVAAHLDSEIMIMDEVLAVGDMAFQKKCLTKMREAAKVEGRTVLYVSHNMNTIRQLCDRCIVMDHGKIVFDGDVEQAIQIYVGRSSTSIEQEKSFDLSDHEKWCNTRVFIDSLRLINEAKGLYIGDLIEFDLSCHATCTLTDLCARLVILDSNNMIVGMSLSNQSICFDANRDINLRISFDTKHLATGNYHLRFSLFQINEYGTHDYVCVINNFITLFLNDKSELHNGMNWDTRSWGHIAFDPFMVEMDK